MMSEGINQPGNLYIHTQLFTTVGLAVKHLPHEQLAAWFDIVRHYVHPANDLEPSLGNKFFECGRFFRIAFEERPEVGNLIQSKLVIGMLFQKLHSLQNIW